MKNNLKDIYSLKISLMALIISFVAIYVNWQSLLVSNRPYLNITPLRNEITGIIYSINKCGDNDYDLILKLQLKNVGKTPANDIHGQTDVFLGLSDKGTCVNAKMEDVLKDNYYFASNSDNFDFKTITDEQINKINDKETQNYLREMKGKDLQLSATFNKNKGWKKLSIFPGDSYTFEISFKILGKDSPWAISNIEKFQKIFLKLKVTYWGIFPKIGRSYYSIYNAELFDGKLMPYEVESY